MGRFFEFIERGAAIGASFSRCLRYISEEMGPHFQTTGKDDPQEEDYAEEAEIIDDERGTDD